MKAIFQRFRVKRDGMSSKDLIKHIPTTSTRYRARLKFLSDLFQGRIFDKLVEDEDPFDDNQFFYMGGRTKIAGESLEDAEWTKEQYLEWLVLTAMTNRVDWIVDNLLGSTKLWQRKKLAEVPVCVTNTQAINVSTHHDGDKLGITVDRGLVAFIDYMLRLIHIEVFRPQRSEFLYNPPTHHDVLRLLREAGNTYHTGKWSASIHPISRLHFRKAINSNLITARTGALFFLIAHEYAHIALGHLSGMAELMRRLDNPPLMTFVEIGQEFPTVLRQETQADNFAMKLALSTIAAISPHEIDRCHLEIGIFLFLFGLHLAELGILLDLGEDFDAFKQTYAHSHSTGLSRATNLIQGYSNRLTKQTPALAVQYLETINSLEEELRGMESQHGRT
jgi:hypothetical protein